MANYLAQFQTIKSSCDHLVIAGERPPRSLARSLSAAIRAVAARDLLLFLSFSLPASSSIVSSDALAKGCWSISGGAVYCWI